MKNRFVAQFSQQIHTASMKARTSLLTGSRITDFGARQGIDHDEVTERARVISWAFRRVFLPGSTPITSGSEDGFPQLGPLSDAGTSDTRFQRC